MMRGGNAISPPRARISRSRVSPLTGIASLPAKREPGSPPRARPICCWISRSRRVRLALGSVEIWDSPKLEIVLQAWDGAICADRRPVGEDGTALPGEEIRPRSQRRGQPALCRSGAVDRADGEPLARPAAPVRPLEHRLQALSRLG